MSAEEYFNKGIKESRFAKDVIPEGTMLHFVIIKAMDDYAESYHKEKLSKLLEEYNDEKIEGMFDPNWTSSRRLEIIMEGKQQGAKEILNALKERTK